MANWKDTLILDDKVSPKLLKMLSAFGKLQGKIAKSTKGLTNFSNKGTNALDKLNRTVEKMNGKFNKLGGLVATIFSVQQMGRFAGFIGKAGMQFEDTLIDLEVMLGSASKAQGMFKDIQKMAIKTPFETSDLLQATKQMLAFGIAEDKILKYSTMLGNISGGDRNKFNSLIYNFSQVASLGKLQGEDFRSFAGAGFNPLKELSTMTGKSMEQLQKDMSKGKISFNMLIKAMEKATGKGGKFYNLMDKRSASFSGKLSNLADTFSLWAGTVGMDIGKKLAPMLDKLIPIIEKILNKATPLFTSMPDKLLNFINKVSPSFNLLINDIRAFTEEHADFVNALKISVMWLVNDGLPKLAGAGLAISRFFIKVADKIADIFEGLGSFIGKIVGFIVTIPDRIYIVFQEIVGKILEVVLKIVEFIRKVKKDFGGAIIEGVKAINVTQQQAKQASNIDNSNHHNQSNTYNISAYGTDIDKLIKAGQYFQPAR